MGCLFAKSHSRRISVITGRVLSRKIAGCRTTPWRFGFGVRASARMRELLTASRSMGRLLSGYNSPDQFISVPTETFFRTDLASRRERRWRHSVRMADSLVEMSLAGDDSHAASPNPPLSRVGPVKPFLNVTVALFVETFEM